LAMSNPEYTQTFRPARSSEHAPYMADSTGDSAEAPSQNIEDVDPTALSVDDEVSPPEERHIEPVHLTVADGFRFGCGFSLAAAGFVFILAIGAAIAALVAAVIGVPLPFGV